MFFFFDGFRAQIVKLSRFWCAQGIIKTIVIARQKTTVQLGLIYWTRSRIATETPIDASIVNTEINVLQFIQIFEKIWCNYFRIVLEDLEWEGLDLVPIQIDPL